MTATVVLPYGAVAPVGGEPVEPNQLELVGIPGRSAGTLWAAYLYKDPRRVGVVRYGSAESGRQGGRTSRGRRPYYGHVRKMGQANWLATTPGGNAGRSFKTRHEAVAFLAKKGQWA